MVGTVPRIVGCDVRPVLGTFARWREAVGHGVVLRLPEGVEDVNDLTQQPDGEAVCHRLVEALPSDPGEGSQPSPGLGSHG